METWDALVSKKRKEILKDYRAEARIDKQAAIAKREERLRKINALCEIESAVAAMLECVEIMGG